MPNIKAENDGLAAYNERIRRVKHPPRFLKGASMKQRLISIAVALVLLAAVLYWYDTGFVNIVFIALGGLAIFECLRALGMGDSLLALFLFAALHAVNMVWLPPAHYIVYFALFLMFCFVMFDKKQRYTFKTGAGLLALFIMISLGLASLLHIRAMSGLYGDRIFMLLISLALGWICDTFAFCFGKWLGKRKMCPRISPNKTVAGGVAGLVGTMVVIAAAFYVYTINANPSSVFYGRNGAGEIAYYAAMGLVGAAVGIIGDLSASLVKRECGIKDFGHIMPGHGGALDRLDSVLFTATFALFAFQMFFKIFDPEFLYFVY